MRSSDLLPLFAWAWNRENEKTLEAMEPLCKCYNALSGACSRSCCILNEAPQQVESTPGPARSELFMICDLVSTKRHFSTRGLWNVRFVRLRNTRQLKQLKRWNTSLRWKVNLSFTIRNSASSSKIRLRAWWWWSFCEIACLIRVEYIWWWVVLKKKIDFFCRNSTPLRSHADLTWSQDLQATTLAFKTSHQLGA